MLYADGRKLFSNVILDPYTLKDLRLVVSWARQDFINSVMNLRTLELARQQIKGGFFSWWGKTRETERALRVVHTEIRKKRATLDDLERALEVAVNNNYEEMERRDSYAKALEEAENEDDARYEKKLEDINRNIELKGEKALLEDIRKQLAEVFFSLEKMDYQSKRRREWRISGPPSRVRDELKDLSPK
jgi:hypothetical protein